MKTTRSRAVTAWAALTPKQRTWVTEYQRTGNASEAYRRAYNVRSMAPATINHEAFLMRQNPKIAAVLGAVTAEARDLALSHAVDSVTNLIAIAEVSPEASAQRLAVARNAIRDLLEVGGVVGKASVATAATVNLGIRAKELWLSRGSAAYHEQG